MPYSLVIGYEAFRTLPKRRAVIEKLRRVKSNGLWLKIDGCGCDSSPTATTRYCDAATEFQALQQPIVADHAGGLMGLSLLAFGGVGGLAHGITLADRFAAASWQRVPQGKAFAPKTRVYFPRLDLMLDRVEADAAVKVSALELPEALIKKFHMRTKRLNALRTTRGPYVRQRRAASFAMHPITRMARGNGRQAVRPHSINP